MTESVSENAIRPISHRSTNDKVFELISPRVKPGYRIADIGAGEGFFSQLLGDHVKTEFGIPPSEVITACDIFPEYYRYPDVPCLKISSNGRLPYDDASIDVACSLEVIEHVEDQFAFTRELHRILRPGGLALISTPNILNLNSRWRNLHSGFATLFDPLLLSSADPVHTSGHINPVSYYYLAYQLRRATRDPVSAAPHRGLETAGGSRRFSARDGRRVSQFDIPPGRRLGRRQPHSAPVGASSRVYVVGV